MHSSPLVTKILAGRQVPRKPSLLAFVVRASEQQLGRFSKLVAIEPDCTDVTTGRCRKLLLLS